MTTVYPEQAKTYGSHDRHGVFTAVDKMREYVPRVIVST